MFLFTFISVRRTIAFCRRSGIRAAHHSNNSHNAGGAVFIWDGAFELSGTRGPTGAAIGARVVNVGSPTDRHCTWSDRNRRSRFPRRSHSWSTGRRVPSADGEPIWPKEVAKYNWVCPCAQLRTRRGNRRSPRSVKIIFNVLLNIFNYLPYLFMRKNDIAALSNILARFSKCLRLSVTVKHEFNRQTLFCSDNA